MKKVTVKNKKVVKTTTPATKGPSKFLVGALIFSLVLLGVVMVAAKNSQDNRSSAAKREVVCKLPKVKVCTNSGKCDCQDPAKPKNAANCKSGTVRDRNGNNICVEKCDKNHVFKEIENSGNWGCVGLPVCKGNEKYDSKSNSCLCKPGYDLVNGSCVSECGKLSTRNSSGVCACDPGYEKSSTGNCKKISCPPNYRFNAATNSCTPNASKDPKNEKRDSYKKGACRVSDIVAKCWIGGMEGTQYCTTYGASVNQPSGIGVWSACDSN